MTPNPNCDECGGTGVEHLLGANVLCGVCISDDQDQKTPTETSSAMHRLGLATCPKCEGARFVSGVKCPFCEGGGRVTLSRHHEYVGLKDTDPAALFLDVDPESKP